jgi:small subunit ribosomal protein S6
MNGSIQSSTNRRKRPVMPLYEHVFLARQDVTSQQVEGMVDQLKGVIEQNGGKVQNTEMWGVKTLAFRIKKNRKAHFTMFHLDAPPAAVAEMERQMRINEDILRFITLKVDAFEEGPSVMMQKRDRDERKDRERGRGRDDDGEFGGRDRDRDRDRDRGRPRDNNGGEAAPSREEA